MDALEEQVTDALVDTWRAMVSWLPAGRYWRVGPVDVALTGVPAAEFNGVFCRPGAPVAAVAEALEQVQATGLPHGAMVHEHADDDIRELVSSSMKLDEEQPLMLLTGQPTETTKAVGLSLRTLTAHEAALHTQVAADGFGVPVELLEQLFPPAFMDRPGIRVYLGESGDQPVTTGVGYTAGEFVGIFSVATPEQFRGRGYGAAVTSRAVRDGLRQGATQAYLMASPMGFPVYERLGFRTLSTWGMWVTP
jgi:GNAT superfamily N-acetyltransferase